MQSRIKLQTTTNKRRNLEKTNRFTKCHHWGDHIFIPCVFYGKRNWRGSFSLYVLLVGDTGLDLKFYHNEAGCKSCYSNHLCNRINLDSVRLVDEREVRLVKLRQRYCCLGHHLHSSLVYQGSQVGTYFVCDCGSYSKLPIHQNDLERSIDESYCTQSRFLDRQSSCLHCRRILDS